MTAIHCHIADTRRQIDEALRLRYQVFAEELGYLEPAHRFVPREVDPFDMLETTVHIVACIDSEPAGVVRILAPNNEVARSNGVLLGVDLESKFDLSPLAERGLQLAETMRYCVAARYRGTAVAAALHAAVVDVSLRAGITHWIGCANTGTDSMEDAHVIRRVAARLGYEHGDIQIEPLAPAAAPVESRHPFYKPHEQRRAGAELLDLSFPRTLKLFARCMTARFIGPPIYDPRFRMCSMPMLMAVSDQRARAAHAGDRTSRTPIAA